MNLGPLNDERDLLVRCIEEGGPVRIAQTVAQIDVCGRCGHTVALHQKRKPRPKPPKEWPEGAAVRGHARLVIG
jgi:ribosome-binding protein aMBF1 (putative translation factor)